MGCNGGLWGVVGCRCEAGGWGGGVPPLSYLSPHGVDLWGPLGVHLWGLLGLDLWGLVGLDLWGPGGVRLWGPFL